MSSCIVNQTTAKVVHGKDAVKSQPRTDSQQLWQRDFPVAIYCPKSIQHMLLIVIQVTICSRMFESRMFESILSNILLLELQCYMFESILSNILLLGLQCSVQHKLLNLPTEQPLCVCIVDSFQELAFWLGSAELVKLFSCCIAKRPGRVWPVRAIEKLVR